MKSLSMKEIEKVEECFTEIENIERVKHFFGDTQAVKRVFKRADTLIVIDGYNYVSFIHDSDTALNFFYKNKVVKEVLDLPELTDAFRKSASFRTKNIVFNFLEFQFLEVEMKNYNNFEKVYCNLIGEKVDRDCWEPPPFFNSSVKV